MAKQVEGTVTNVTDAGDLQTDIIYEKWKDIPPDASTKVVVDGEHETFGLFPAVHDQPAMTFIAIADANQVLRLTLIGDSASSMLGVKAGARVVIKW